MYVLAITVKVPLVKTGRLVIRLWHYSCSRFLVSQSVLISLVLSRHESGSSLCLALRLSTFFKIKIDWKH
jgi:hypothetical protein